MRLLSFLNKLFLTARTGWAARVALTRERSLQHAASIPIADDDGRGTSYDCWGGARGHYRLPRRLLRWYRRAGFYERHRYLRCYVRFRWRRQHVRSLRQRRDVRWKRGGLPAR